MKWKLTSLIKKRYNQILLQLLFIFLFYTDQASIWEGVFLRKFLFELLERVKFLSREFLFKLLELVILFKLLELVISSGTVVPTP